MTLRPRKYSSIINPDRAAKNRQRNKKRQRLLETLEPRQLLAGPQLIGIQPNEGDLILDGSVLDVAPVSLTFKFDEDQVIDSSTFDGIRVTRAGADGQLGTDDDVELDAGLVTLGDTATNEVVVRFADALPDDQYKAEVFGFDDNGLGITGLRNTNDELLLPRVAGQRLESTTFTLKLGAQIEAIVPQPVVRLADGSLVQNRNEIVVYFNEDPLFVEDDAGGNPTERSAEHPRFYQLFLTQDTVRTTDDALYHPDEVVYDQATHTARLIFSDDLNQLGPDSDGNAGVTVEGGTFRLRIGTAVDDRVDVVLPPLQVPVAASATTDFGIDGLLVEFRALQIGEAGSGIQVDFEDTGSGLLTVRADANNNITFDFGGSVPRVQDLRQVVQADPIVQNLINVFWSLDGVPQSVPGGALQGLDYAIGRTPLLLAAGGDTLETALDVGVFSGDDGLTSLVFSESIGPQPFQIELPGGNDDAGRPEVSEILNGGIGQYINDQFGLNGADVTDGITEVAYNFQGIYATVGSQSFLNQITDRQRLRIREALDAWSAKLGIQFRETVDQGITFAVGDPSVLPSAPGNIDLSQFNSAYNASLRIDPTFDTSIFILSNELDFDLAYGESFTRFTAAGIGLLIGLELAPNLPLQTLMTAAPVFLSPTPPAAPGVGIDFTGGLEPIFPGNFDVLHGQHLYRPDGNDVDLFRFEVDLGDADQVGTLTAETFAERLADSSLLDTSLTLFQEVRAYAESDLGVGSDLLVRFDSLENGKHGNGTQIEFFRSSRTGADNEIRISQPLDTAGQPISNAILVDVPFRSAQIPTVTAGEIVDAINQDPFASGLMRASIVRGAASTDISDSSTILLPIRFNGGGVERLSRNDDYFSEDSRLIANLGAGVYYVGVSASGNESYDPTTTQSGFGGLTQGNYDLHLKFEPQVDETDVLRDLDSDRVDVPGTPLDGDADGVPGGVNNFWFQTRSANRQLSFNSNGAGVTNGQTITIVGGSGVVRTYEFVLPGQSTSFGNVPLLYNDGSAGTTSPSASLAFELRNAINSRTNETGVQATLNGSIVELTGERSIELSGDFRGADVLGRNIFVDKTASPLADGSLSRPFNNIANPDEANAFDSAMPGDIVRIVGNGGLDGNLATEADNFSYQIGVAATGGAILEDGRNMEVPQGVTTMIDAGAVLKFRTSRIGVGSSTLLKDRSGGVLQVLGTPRLVQLSAEGDPLETTLIADQDELAPGFSDGSVILTSIKDRAADTAAAGLAQDPLPGDWGGLVFRRDLDRSEGRGDLEDEGIFLQTVNNAQIRYGGGSNVLIDSVQQLVNPIQIFELRPSITFNEISFSADAAISASPDSFEETSFQAPRFQQGGSFTADYSRIGPEIHDNQLIDNSINGLFVRVSTTPGQAPRALTTSGRFDDSDIVHYFAENIAVQGTPGGSIQDEVQPDLVSTAFNTIPGGGISAGTYDYRMTFVDAFGFESLPSDPSPGVTVTDNASIELLNLQQVPNATDYISRRLYRLDLGSGEYRLIANLDATDVSYLDDGRITQGTLNDTRTGIRARLDASLVIDPGTVLKFRGTRIELGQGTQLLAEGTNSQPIVFTSFADDRFGSGGTFDTNNDNESPSGSIAPSPGDWSGIYAGPNSSVSLDHTSVAFGGGISLLAGGQGRGFAALELQEAEGRVTNSRFEFNANAQAGSGPAGRLGLLSVTPATIFVRGSQPTIVGNVFASNQGSIIDINSDSMTADRIIDLGRQTGSLDRFSQLDDNYGPLIRLNRYAEIDPSAEGTQISGLEIRGGELAGPSVWDDTDIVHLVFQTISTGNVHSEGGLRLLSKPNESLVVKFIGGASPYNDNTGVGLTATGELGNIADRIGGSLQLVGAPGFPVVLTSFHDDSVGAGLTPEGTAFTDSNGDGASRGTPNDWRGILLDQYSNDRNVDFLIEQTIVNEIAPGLNGSVTNAQVLGDLASSTLTGNDQFRLGFEVEGVLSADSDIDTYSFQAEAGTQIWIDVDDTTLTLDTVVEILDADGNVLARSDNSFDEVAGTPLENVAPDLTTGSLQFGAVQDDDIGAGGLYNDYASTNIRDAGMSLFLPGNPGTRSVYFFRIRSASINQDDRDGGITNGSYRFQLRLQEDQEFPGSVIRYTDIRYANHGINAVGLGDSSPFLGDAQEDEQLHPNTDNNVINYDPSAPESRPQYIGNLLQSKDKVFSIGGALSTGSDIDFYQIDVSSPDGGGALQTSTVFDIDYADGFSRPNTSLVVFYDRDGQFGSLPPELVLISDDSNIIDDIAKPVSSSPIDLLTRGSITTGDPLIGPVSLSEGTYYVGVIGDGAADAALNNINTRREPIESILRIFEDHVEEIGGSTALPPREGAFIDASSLPAGWVVTTDRALDTGHNRTDTFNSSRNEFSAPSIQNEPTTANNTFAAAIDLDAAQPIWSLGPDGDIGDSLINTSQSIPHTTVNGTIRNDFVDVYQFEVTTDSALAIIDIDGGFDPELEDNDGGLFNVTNPTNVDLGLTLFEEISPGVVSPISTSFGSLATQGAGGSVPQSTIFGTTFTTDPFLETTLAAGTYFIAVTRDGVTYDPLTDTFDDEFADTDDKGDYTLHVSLEGHANRAGNPDNASYHFDRSLATAELDSNAFSLAGYSAQDLPKFYFNYFYDPSGTDSVMVEAMSAQSPTFVALDDVDFTPTTGTSWRQSFASLADFAGHDDIVIRFTYETDVASTGGEGIYLDDFVIGFAERGELITGAGFDDISISGGGTTPGEYQLEIRPGSEHANPVLIGPGITKLELTETFDTNARQTTAATVVAPHATQINDGDTFRLSDGVRTIQFEFDFSPTPDVTSGNIRIPISVGDAQSDVADAIRTAINLPSVQSTIAIQASDSSGSATGGSGDIQVALTGLLIGDFLELDSPVDVPDASEPLDPSGGSFRLPVVFSEGFGDRNVERAQTQLILDSNKVSDAYGIGIWSQYADRVQDPKDDVIFDANRFGPFDDTSNIFVDRGVDHATPRLGATSPGAVRNLPSLNDDVPGGVTPGVVIVNNTLDQAGYAGIKIDGQNQPFVIDSPSEDFRVEGGGADNIFFGRLIADGLVMDISAAGQTVRFEFEDISGGPIPTGGSGEIGGDGWTDGHIPIYYRESNTVYAIGTVDRGAPSTRVEVMWSIYQSILGSPLVTNGLVELVEPSIGPSRLYERVGIPDTILGETEALPAVYVEGASNLTFDRSFQKRNFSQPFDWAEDGRSNRVPVAPIYVAPQSFARVVNNTIYGKDGVASSYFEPGTDEPNDLPSNAADTRRGSDHGPLYQSLGEIGGEGTTGTADVDFYEVELGLGDRLTVDIDTQPGGPDTYVRIFDSNGIEVFANDGAVAPAYLNGILEVPVIPVPLDDPDSAATPNQDDPFVDFAAPAPGTYFVAVSSEGNETYDPLTLSGRDEGLGGTGPYGITINTFAPRNFVLSFDAGGQTTDFSALIGTTITVTHVANVDDTPGDLSDERNTTTYEFVDDDFVNPPEPPTDPANVAIPIFGSGDTRIPDIMRAISLTMNDPDLDGGTSLTSDPRDSDTVIAFALGGELGDGPGLITFDYANYDLQGFGHDRETAVGSPGPGTTETFVFALGIADLTLSPEAAAAGLQLGPFSGSNAQAGIPEAGLVTTAGTSATVMNNLFANLDTSRVDDGRALVIVNGNLTQDETNGSLPNDDFNVNLNADQILFENADGNNFLPDQSSFAIDSAINSVIDREDIRQIRESIGLPNSNLLAPDRDINGVKRADNPDVAPPGGIGGFVFKDRGSNELADFVGPVAIANTPLDNDSQGIDIDATSGFIQLSEGTLDEFRIQLRDTGDASDPFPGLGINDSTVVVPEIDGLRTSGANVTLFEDEQMLVEGIDYSFSYDATQNVITLTPLAGTWESERAYRIQLNNRERNVLIAPDSNGIVDGAQLAITDDDGATITFEFETGFSLSVPEPITLLVPQVGTNAGGLRDGDVFQIDDGINDVVTFEFNLPGDAKLPDSVEVELPDAETPTSPAELQAFLEQIATNMALAIQSQIDAGVLDADVRALGNRVVVGTDPGAIANTSLTALEQLPRTLAFQVPPNGVGTNGIADGDTFQLSNGTVDVVFEFDTDATLNDGSNESIPLSATANAEAVALAIQNAIANSVLNFTPTVEDDDRTVYLNLPSSGSAEVLSGRLLSIGLSRSLVDGDTIVITGTDGADVTFEVDAAADGVAATNVGIEVNRFDTADEIANKVRDAIATQTIPGLDPNQLVAVPGGLVSIGGDIELQLEVTGESMEVVGSPSVATQSTIEVLGPILLTFSDLGAGVIEDGSVLVLTDDQGEDVVFEFNAVGTGQTVPGAIEVAYLSNATDEDLADSLAAAVNGSNADITATTPEPGQVSFGQIDSDRVSIADYPDPNNPAIVYDGVIANLRRGLVSDGEMLTIRQGDVEITYEFESSVNGGGVSGDNETVLFQPGSSAADVGASLAAAINNNSDGLTISASADAEGVVTLDDQPGTVIDASLAPTLKVSGVPGGAIPVFVSPGFSAIEVKRSLIRAINSVNTPERPNATTLSAEDRGGATLFVTGGEIFIGPVESFALPAIADVAGNPLEANREDLTTQFTILMPNVGLDFGDAADPIDMVDGQYPTKLIHNGPRHVIDDQLFLGSISDADTDGLSSVGADGDDLNLQVTESGDLFVVTLVNGNAEVVVQEIDALTRDGDTITIDTGVGSATLEFDIDGLFDEDNFAIRPVDASSLNSIAIAIQSAIAESGLPVAAVTVDGDTATVLGDDEDGVKFTSPSNPMGVLNEFIALPIEVTVTGAGVVEAWIDFKGDGEFNRASDQVIPMDDSAAAADLRHELCPANLTGTVSNIFSDTGEAVTRTFCIVVPASITSPVQPIETAARVRVSREGNLGPTGLALSGEVEDYSLTILPGNPPSVSAEQAQRSYSVNEEQTLNILDADGTLSTSTADDGLLAGIIDVNGDAIEIFADDVGNRILTTPSGTVAGNLNLLADGTFSFVPVEDFNGSVEFQARVTDVHPLNPETNLVSPQPITVTITIDPVNDPPFATPSQMQISRTINEDEVQTFTAAELIGDMYAAGPENELDQLLILQSAGSSNGAFTTTLGGTLSIASDGLSIEYTPPMDENGPATDSFTYVVADVPGAGQTSLSAPTEGTVVISFQEVNDPPITNFDSYNSDEGVIKEIGINLPIDGENGILQNDAPGPADEDTQTLELVANQFPKTTDGGGTIALNNDGTRLIYTPAPFYSGTDRFEYTVADNLGATATEEVLINVGGVNNAPMFVGVEGNPGQTTIVRDEAKTLPETVQFQLDTWFTDPDSTSLIFTVTSNNEDVVIPEVQGNNLTLEFPSFGFGIATLTVTASDGIAAPTTQQVGVTVNNTPDSPMVVGTLNPQSVNEDGIISANLANVFFDPDGEPLTYAVARIDGLLNPTQQQITDHPLIRSISFENGQMRIELEPNQSGEVNIEISASDNVSTPVSDSFTLTVNPVPDAPIAVADQYNVPIGSALTILSVSSGLLQNDSDADGDTFTVATGSATSPSRGSLVLNEDGTFVYTNTSGTPADTDSFEYHIIDSTGRISETVQVTFNLNESAYQNPLTELNEDVNADGSITAIDALRVINFLGRRGSSDVPVSEIGAPPPDFYDVNGDGRVSALDALNVVNELARINNRGSGEQAIHATDVNGPAALAATSNFVSGSTVGMPIRNLQPVTEQAELATDRFQSNDQILAAGFEINSVSAETAVDSAVPVHESAAPSDEETDTALTAVLEDLDDLGQE